jgi:hypothetical protein
MHKPIEVAFIDFLFRQRDIWRAQVAGRDDPKRRDKVVFLDEILEHRERPALAKLKGDRSR